MLKYKGIFLLLVLFVSACNTLDTSEDVQKATVSNSPLPKKKQFDPEAAMKAHLIAGVQYLGEGEMTHAHRHLKRALELDADSVEVHNALAVFYQAEGDVDREQFHFRKALEIDSENSSVRHNYGSALCRRGDFEGAREYLSKAAADYGYANRAETYQNLGLCEVLAGDKNAARIAFQNAYRLDNKLPKVILGLAKINLEEGQNGEAYRLHKEFLEISRQNAESLWLGIQLERIFGNKDALASYELALRKLHPGSNEYILYQKSLAPSK